MYSALGRIRHATRGTPGAFAVVAGCVAQQIGAGFFERFPQVRLVVGSDGIAMAPQAIARLCDDPNLRLDYTLFSESYPERDPALSGAPGETPGPIAYVNIMQGCDNFCAYCIVPYTRGRQKSRATGAILDECRAALDNGAKEITLLGQNVNAFGLDAHGDPGVSFPGLLRQAAALPGLERLRFVTPHPKDFSPETTALFADLPVLCPRLHLPLQAGSDAVLTRMRRRYDRAGYLRLVEELRRARPDLALSTDIIVGFPGESEADFQIKSRPKSRPNVWIVCKNGRKSCQSSGLPAWSAARRLFCWKGRAARRIFLLSRRKRIPPNPRPQPSQERTSPKAGKGEIPGAMR